MLIQHDQLSGRSSARMFAPADIAVEARPDGTRVFRSRIALPSHAATVLDWLEDWAARTPDVPLLTEGTSGGARRVLDYAAALGRARALGEGLLHAGMAPGRPVLVLAPNGADHLCLGLACMIAGLPWAPISPLYGRDPAGGKLRHVIDTLRPAAIYLADRGDAPALATIDVHGTMLLVGPDSLARLARPPSERIATARAAIDPHSPAKLLMTSGSTGMPKAVICTQAGMTASQAMTNRVWLFLHRGRPILVDWLPWNHAFAGNHHLSTVLSLGGTLHLDEGGGAPERLDRTLRNLATLRPTLYGAVPAGLASLLPALERDAGFREGFLFRLDAVFSAGAALTDDTWDRFTRVAARSRGGEAALLSGWGCTETGPGATLVHSAPTRPSNIGTALPGVAVKLSPQDGKFELRVRGPNVMPGYWGVPRLTEAAFDEEGFYRTGDAGLPVDPDRPEAGLRFDGRLGENFKLATGTWVSAGPLRLALLRATAPLVIDLVLIDAGAEIAALLWLAPAANTGSVSAALSRYNEQNPGASTRIARMLALSTPPSLASGEINEKAYINPRAVITHRAAAVARLREGRDADILHLTRQKDAAI